MEFDFTLQPGLSRRGPEVMKTETPLISIITPFYNGGKHIRQTMNCVLDQTFPYFEWIIVDDGSTDPEDLALLEEIRKEDPRIRILHKENGGISSARNHGIRNAVTELILPLDDDDLLEPTFVEYCWWMLEKNPGAAWAYTDSVGFQGQEYLWHKKFDPEEMKRENLLTATALIRREALESIGLYREGTKHYNEDWYAWLKLLARGGYPVQSSGEYLFWYRRTDTGVLSKVQTDRLVAQKNRRLINSAAVEIREPKKPVRYPESGTYNWTRPELSRWDKQARADKQSKHILFLFPHLEMGGADKFNLDLMAGLDRERFETGIITTVPSENRWQQAFRQITPEIFNLPNFLDPRDYGEFISYYIKSRQVDVLFVSNSYHGYYLVPWLREHFPELAIVDYVHMEEWYWRNGGYARTSAMVGAVTEKTYVCNSATRDVMVNHYKRNAASVETVYIGVDETYFDRKAEKPGTLYRELGIAEDRPIVLFICRLHPQKRPFLMLQIAKQVKAQLPDVAFAVVGDGPQGQELQKAARAMGLENTVYFLGARKEVRPYYRDAKATLVCSLKEGLSLTAYESCAMGVPVVSADVGGQRDLIDEEVGRLIPCRQPEAEGFDARSFDPEEIRAYSDALTELLTDTVRWEEASRTCRERIEQGFTIQRMVEYFESEFLRLTEDKGLETQRRTLSRMLQSLSPMAAELFTAEMQMQSTEDLHNQPKAETLPVKILRVLCSEGLLGLVKKVIIKVISRLYKKPFYDF